MNLPKSNPVLGVAILRTALGAMFVAHAWLKYAVFTLPGTAQFFVSMGLPAALGYLVFFAELVGGVMLIIGMRTREVALLLTPILVGATFAHWGNGWKFSAPGGGWEYPAFLALSAIALFYMNDAQPKTLRQAQGEGRSKPAAKKKTAPVKKAAAKKTAAPKKKSTAKKKKK